jgi:hypothetical protein
LSIEANFSAADSTETGMALIRHRVAAATAGFSVKNFEINF